MPRFAANLGYLFTDRALLERIDAAADAGFKAIELQFPYDVPAAQVKAAIDAQHAHDPRRQHAAGRARRRVRHGGGAGPREGFRGAVRARARLHHGDRRHARSIASPARWRPSSARRPSACFIDNLKRAADLAAAKNITLLIEPINARDRPNYFLNHVEHAADVIAKAGKPNIKIQFDFYHVQIVGGDIIYRLEKYLPVIGHLQCAAVPSRHEPDEGEVNYPAVFAAVDRLGYRGWIGAEYRPRGRTEDGLGWAQPYGVVPLK